MKKGRDGTPWRELEDEIEPIVYTTTQEWGDIRMADMADGSNLCEKLLLFSLISWSFCEPFHSKSLPIFHGSSVNLCIPSFSDQIIWNPDEKNGRIPIRKLQKKETNDQNKIFHGMG